MNANLFRLVFSSARGMWVPVWEGARACSAGGGGSLRKKTRRVALQVNAGVLLLMLSAAHAELPIPCAGGMCGTSTLPNVPFASSGRADFSSDGSNALIQQYDQRVILNWQSFNIGAGNSVEFKQPGAGSAALNHIWQGDASRIAGKLNANGQVYLINQNGILFDKGAQVNVHSLIASSLNIDDQIFKSGSLFSQVDDSGGGSTSGLKHALAGDDASGAIVVNVDASLTAKSGGKIMLFAPTIENSGTIKAPDGQVILAAGKKVYLQGSQDIKLRGLLVEVDGGGTVTNTAGAGTIIAERGNITLMGLAVNQMGRVSATTSVRANGSIRLLARDTPLLVDRGPDDKSMSAQRTGQVLLGAGSITEVMPEVNDSATIDDNVAFNLLSGKGDILALSRSFVESMPKTRTLTEEANILAPSQSFVEVMGKTIRHEGDIIAPSGLVSLRALSDPSDTSPNPARDDSRVYLSETSRIDVSGTEEVVLPMSRNQIEVELRGDELKDYPLQRDGVLRGEKVTIDVRKGTPVADVSKHLKAIPRTVEERTVEGGTVNIESQGDVITRSGSVIDVSGGEVRYLDGFINTTRLIAQGKVYDIGDAPADLVYDGILGAYTKHSMKWGVTERWLGSGGEFTPGYSEGKDAGTVSFKGYGLALDGSLQGSATAGRYQREAGKIPLGGKLVVGDYMVNPGEQLDAVRDAVFQVAPAFSSLRMDDALTQRLVMSTDFITRGGFSRIDMTRGGRITVPVDLQLPAGGEVKLSAGQLDVDADISAPSGTITLRAEKNLTISPDSVISARGLWVNDLPRAGGEGTGPALIKGGAVSISAGIGLTLGEADAGIVRPMTIDVSGGGWLDVNGKLKKGDGGDVNIKSDGTLLLGAALQGHALGKGGTLTLSSGKVLIRDGVPLSTPSGLTLDAADLSPDASQPGLFVIPSWMFSTLGFTSYEVNATFSDLTVASGTTLALQAPYLELGADYGMRASGANLRDFTRLEALPERRSPVSLALNHNAVFQTGSRLNLETGARIEADPGASVLLSTKIGMVIDGEINAPAGKIGLTLSANDKLAFLPEQAIWLGAQSRLLAAGAVQLQPDAQGLRRGEVLAGGQINIEAQRGYIVAETGAVMDVSGAQTHLDLPVETGGIHRESTPVASSAGAINLTAAEGMLLDAALLGKAGDGAPAAGGALSLRLTSTNLGAWPEGDTPFPTSDRLIVLREGDALAPRRDGVVRGEAIPAALNGQAFFNTGKLAQGGFERFSAQSDDEIRFQGDVDIALKRSVVLDAPALNVLDNTVNVSARYVALGSSDQRHQSAPPATGGSGQLNVSADLIDLIGNSALQGVKETNLYARDDIRLRGVLDSTTSRLMGSFSVTDDLNLQARQVYPATLSEFEIKSRDGTVRILPDTNPKTSPAPVLSAAGKLTVSAPRIENQGVLKAPLGEINLNGTGDAGQIVLGAGSQTSVSAEGLVIPFGKTQNGKDWVYGVGEKLTRVLGAPPQKNLRLTAENIDLRPGAEINLSGNGDLYAYEFIPGPGGSTDVLVNIFNEGTTNEKANTRYAILPTLGASFAPYDPQYYSGSTLTPGDSVYLSGAEGLAAGFYTLLPPRYALLPGAWLVTARNGYQDILPGQGIGLADGSQIVAGKYAAGSEALDSRWSGFTVSPGTLARTQAEYQDRYANTFFTEQARANDVLTPLLPGDAGRLIIAAGQTLTLDATLQASRAAGRRGAAVDISATKLAVVTPQTAAGQADKGFVTLDAASLTRLGAESLLLGGTRSLTKAGEEIKVSSSKVVVANDAAHALAAPEVILVANDEVQVQAGSAIEGVGDAAGKREKVILGSVKNGVDGDGALLRVASGERLEIVRNNTDRASGNLNVERGALLTGRSVELDATQTNTFNGRLDLKEKGSLSMGAGRISFGETASVIDGLVFSPGQLAALATVGNMTLRSYSTVDFWGDVTLGGVDGSGNPLLSKLFVEAGGINGYANAGKTVHINAGEFSFTNPGNIVTPPVAGGGGPGAQATQGTLVVTAQDVILGEGRKTLSGFDHVKIAARNEITAQGKGTLEVPGALVLEAARLGATKRADQAYTAAGDVTIARPAQSVNLPAASALAARLAITGSSIQNTGTIDLPSGEVTLTARTGDVVLADRAQIATRGVTKTFDGVAVSSPAGKVNLVSDQGNVAIQRGALVDVSGVGSNGDAGTLSISAIQGRTSLQGQIKGGVADNSTGRQGRFVLDTNVVNNDSTRNSNDFTALNQKLNEGQFNSERTIRLRGNDKFDVNGALLADVNGDVLIEANGNGVDNTVKAQTFRLTADNGKIDVLGSIDASGKQGGVITLSARDDVTLHGGSVLDAHATGSQAQGGSRGGRVELATSAGSIDVQDQAAIDVSGNGPGGRVLLRAPATASDENIAAIAGTIKGASDVTVEAVKVYQADTIDSSLISTWQSELSTFMDTANIDAIKTRLNKASDTAFYVVPGLEVQSAQTLTLANNWNLSGWRFGGTNQPGVLTLRAADSLKLNATLSDGFAGIAPGSLLQADRSWSYRLVGGADLNSADPLALLPAGQLAAGTGDVVIAAGKLVRTGSGAIDIAAGGNFELGKDASGVNKSTAAVYTAGQSSPALADFTLPRLTDGTVATRGSVNYPTGGGDLRIQAGKDVKGAITHQLITEWLQRQGQTNALDGTLLRNRNPSWWVNFSKFQQNIGALGGGNVSVIAGNNIDNLSVVIPTTGRLAGAPNTPALAENLLVTGGGDMRIEADGDIRSGIYYVGKGVGTIRAGGSLEAGRKVSDTNPSVSASDGSLPVHAIFALGDGRFDVRAGGNIKVETVINPTVVAQDTSVVTLNNHPRTYFFTYSPDSAAEFTALAGDATFVNDVEAIQFSVAKVGTRNGILFRDALNDSGALGVYPGGLAARALEGNILVKNKATLFPSVTGNLQLLAAGNVDVEAVNLSDADPALLLNPLYIPAPGSTEGNRQVGYSNTNARLTDNGDSPRLSNAASPVHAEDDEPVRVVASNGNIKGKFRLSKLARLIAGKDITNLSFDGQNVKEADVTLLQAGRDIVFSTQRDATTGVQQASEGRINLGGPGRLEIRAGRNVDLGNSAGIVSRGNLVNPNLPAQGADVTVMAGVGDVKGYESFVDKYFNPKNQLTAQDYKNSAELIQYIKEKLKMDGSTVTLTDAKALQEFNRQATARYAQELTQYMRGLTNNSALTQDEALAAFKALAPEQQQPFVIKSFYSELRDAGREYNKIGKSGYARGFEAIATLFPGKTTGDLSLLFSQIKTEAGGDINIFVPGGKVNAGQTTPPAESGSTKTADQLGIMAQNTGAVRAFVKDDFAVNESRVFTLGGGDILMWSSEGDIDAGKGAKTAVSAPAPVPITDKNGITTFKFLSVAGSGIRSILVDKGVKAGDVDLIAPNGEINAGDAGIGAAGNINLAALRVVGADNIQVGGVSVGVPVADTGGLGSSLSGVSNLSADTSKIAEKATQDLSASAANPMKNTFRPSFLRVEVIGFGD